MNSNNDERLYTLLKQSLPPLESVAPRRDLWPDMLKRIHAGHRTPRFGRLDWILTGLVAASVLAFPTLIPGILYHL
jgi:hypothetical protein